MLPRFNLRFKVLIAFIVVLLPMLVLIVYDYFAGYNQWSEKTLDDQLTTGQAIAALTDASIDDALSAAWSFGKDPTIQTMNPRTIDPYLESLQPLWPQFDDIAVFDAQGNNVGSMVLHLPPDSSRPGIADRPYFQTVKSTGKPVVSNVLISKATSEPIVVAAVPMFGESGEVKGVAITTMDVDYLVKRVSTVGLSKSQAIFITDPEGTMAFQMGVSREEWGHRSMADYPPVQSALKGVPGRERSVLSPMGDYRMVATTRTAEYGWVVGVSAPASAVLQPVQNALIQRLLLFTMVLVFAGVVTALLSRRLILHPLHVLMDNVVAFGCGQLHRRVALKTGDEMELLANKFNEMAEQLQQWNHERETLLQDTIEAHRELEETRRRREEFIAMVAHDFRNPLAVIVGYSEMITRAIHRGKPVEPRIADSILCQAKRMRRFIDDLSDMSLIEAGRFKLLRTTCDLGKIAQDTVENHQLMSTKHHITLDAPAESVVGNWDCDRLTQALNNLVGNAVKYSPSGGEVVVQISTTDQEAIVSVHDQGIGIAPEEVPQLFQAFSKVNKDRPIRGTGLGLFITKAIAAAHGGRIEVKSEQDKGSTFVLAVPF